MNDSPTDGCQDTSLYNKINLRIRCHVPVPLPVVLFYIAFSPVSSVNKDYRYMHQIISLAHFLQMKKQNSDGQGIWAKFVQKPLVQQALKQIDKKARPEIFGGLFYEAMAPPSDDEENDKVNATGWQG